MKPRLLTPALLTLLAALLLAPTVSAAVERTVAVTATTTRKVANDSASLGFSVSKERRTRGAALRAVSSKLRGVIAAVQGVPGVGEGDVTTGRISVRKVSRGSVFVYRASEGIGVILHQPENAGDLVTAAISAGATGTSGPNFFVGDSQLAYSGALTAAFEAAKAKATALAAAAGATLGPALTIEEGGDVYSSPETVAKDAPASGCAAPTFSKRAGSDCAASPPVKPGTSTVTATVRVIFALQ